ncbi:MAG: hypothetical protein AAF985_19865 [Bacteroidota bacterium]
MRQFLLVSILFLTTHPYLQGQCIATTPWQSSNAPTSGTVISTITIYGGDYHQVNNVAAYDTYQSFVSNLSSYLTVTEGSPTGTVIAHGYVDATTTLTWYSNAAGTYYVHVHADAICGVNATSHTLEMTYGPPPTCFVPTNLAAASNTSTSFNVS